MKLDFLELLGSALGTTIGRILLPILIAHLGAGLGAGLGASIGLLDSPSLMNFFGLFIVGIPFLLVSIFTTTAFFVVPVLFGFTALFARYEWDLKFLLIPFVLSAYAGFVIAM